MGYISWESRNQRYLLPETIDDYIGEDNPVQFVDAFVEKLDLRELGFERAIPGEMGGLAELYRFADYRSARECLRRTL